MILITHDLGVVAGVADRVLVMYAGRAAELGAVDDVFAAPAHAVHGRPARVAAVAQSPARAAPRHPRHAPTGLRIRARLRVRAALPARRRALRQQPALVAVGAGHVAACHFAGPEAGGSRRPRSSSRQPQLAASGDGHRAGTRGSIRTPSTVGRRWQTGDVVLAVSNLTKHFRVRGAGSGPSRQSRRSPASTSSCAPVAALPWSASPAAGSPRSPGC